MVKIFSAYLGISALLFFFFFLPKPVSAHHARDVLGDATDSSDLAIAPTAEGPGLILPDSPIFFLDELKQNVRLLLAFTPEQRAKVHRAVAGERLAELQFMLAKNNAKGIRVALQGVSDNFKKAAADLSEARLKGKDVKLLARATNDTIKEKQKKLSILEENASGEMKAQVKAAREALRIAKVEVEDSLPESELENEIEEDLEDEIEDHVRIASDSAKGLEHAIDVLGRLASQAAEKQQTRREEALRHAIEVKNEALIKQQKKHLEFEDKKQEKLLKAHEKVIDKAREAAKKARGAAEELKEAREEVHLIRSTNGSGSSGSDDN